MPGAARRSKGRESRPRPLRAGRAGGTRRDAPVWEGLVRNKSLAVPPAVAMETRAPRLRWELPPQPPPPLGCPERSAAVIPPVKAARLPYSTSDFTHTNTLQLFFIFFSFFFVSLAKHRRRENRINRRGNNCVAAHAHRGKEEKHLQVR